MRRFVAADPAKRSKFICALAVNEIVVVILSFGDAFVVAFPVCCCCLSFFVILLFFSFLLIVAVIVVVLALFKD